MRFGMSNLIVLEKLMKICKWRFMRGSWPERVSNDFNVRRVKNHLEKEIRMQHQRNHR